MYVNELEHRNHTAISFKQQYPRLYRHIIKLYGGRKNIFDITAAICLYLLDIPNPTCNVCNIPLAITKKYKTCPSTWNNRCTTHVNTNNVITVDAILQTAALANVEVDVTQLLAYPTRSHIISIICPHHGEYTQSIGYFLDGGTCQQCYVNKPRNLTSYTEWVNKCNSVHNTKYIYTTNGFTSLTDAATIECPIHGRFEQNAGVHSRGHGCNKCATDNAKQRTLLTATEFINNAVAVHGDTYDYSMVEYESCRKHISIICKTHGEFLQVPYYHTAGNGCPECGKHVSTTKSAAEFEIIDFLKLVGITNIMQSWRGLGFEIDIYLPDYKVGIEYDGIYWHSSAEIATDKKFAQQHLHKTTECENNGIFLLHIFDLEWNNADKQDIWKSMIVNKLGLTPTRLYARKCNIVMVQSKTASAFYAKNHMQGMASGALNIGLSHNGVLVSIATFSKSRYRKQTDNCYELLRFASAKQVSVVGGFNKIMAEFTRTHSGVLISYANRRWSQGNVYIKCNFTLVSVAGPCYYYTNCKQMWHRSVFQKHKLSAVLPKFDESRTEVANMYENNYRRIWDCGNLVFELEIK